MDQYQYLLVLAGCLAITAPLESFGRGVYRRPAWTARAVLPVAAVFVAWDALAILGDVWTYNPRYVSGFGLPGMPIEELLFFIVIPLCGLLTYNAVDTILSLLQRLRARSERPS